MPLAEALSGLRGSSPKPSRLPRAPHSTFLPSLGPLQRQLQDGGSGAEGAPSGKGFSFGARLGFGLLRGFVHGGDGHRDLPQAGAEPKPEEASEPPEAAARQEPTKERTLRLDWAGLLRRSFALDVLMISLARTDGARKDILELCTHSPRKSGSAIDLDTTFPWEALCAEVAKLKVQRHERG